MSIISAMDAAALSREILSLLDVTGSAQVPAWAAQHIAALVGASGARVLHVYPGAAARKKGAGKYAVAADGEPFPVPEASDLYRAIESRQPVRANGALLVPFAAFDEARYVIEVSGASRDITPVECLLPVVGCYFERMVDAETDSLTRLANRRVFYPQMSAGLPRWAKGGQRWFLAVADIDRFKQVNDRFGHLYGDEILIHFARLMRSTFRAGDLLFRFGGEEFVAVYGVDGGENGDAPLERFRRATMAYAFPRVGQVTVSIGFAAIGDGLPATTLIDHADQALYYAKAHGRNRVCAYEKLVAAGEIKAEAAPQSEATLF